MNFPQVRAFRIFMHMMPFERLLLQAANTKHQPFHHAARIELRVTGDIIVYRLEVFSRLFGPRNFHALTPNSLQTVSCECVFPASMSASPASIFCLT